MIGAPRRALRSYIMVITTGMVREIRRRREARETLASIADALGLHPHTVWKYASDKNTQAAIRRDLRSHERIKADPERLARRREAARRCMERKRVG